MKRARDMSVPELVALLRESNHLLTPEGAANGDGEAPVDPRPPASAEAAERRAEPGREPGDVDGRGPQGEGQGEAVRHPAKGAVSASASRSSCRTAGPAWSGIRQAPALAEEGDILDLLGRDLGRLGVTGEDRLVRVLYLALTSRLLPWGQPGNRPVSAIVKGASSTGKSFTVGCVLRFLPEDAVVTLTSASNLFLLYAERSLAHTFVYVPEWSGIEGKPELVTLLRVLVSEGEIRHGTVEGLGRKEARELRKQGPTGLLVTTTAAVTDPELETRCVSLRTDDSRAQTRRIFEAVAALETGGGSGVDFAPWHELQGWLAGRDNRVAIPFVEALAALMPTSTTRLRRDFVSLLSLVRAHALLHQATRKRDRDGRVLATLDDYAAVRDLVGDLLAEGADAYASPAIRETVGAVARIVEEGAQHATARQVAERLAIGRNAADDRIRRALAAGYLTNVAATTERGRKLRPGQPLPDEPEFLPPVDAVAAFAGPLPDRRSGNENGFAKPKPGRLLDAGPCRTVRLDEQISVGSSPSRRPLVGDDGWLDPIGAGWRAGHVTAVEWRRARAAHRLVRLDPPAILLAALPAGADRLVRDLRAAGLDPAGIAAETGLPAEAVERLLARDEFERLLSEGVTW